MTDAVPPPATEWQEERPWEDDSLATFEEANDPLDAQLLEQDKRNRLSFKKATGRIIVVAVYFAAAVLGVGLFVWAWHFITPWPFLSPQQLERLQSVIFSGAIGAVVSALSRSYLRNS